MLRTLEVQALGLGIVVAVTTELKAGLLKDLPDHETQQEKDARTGM